jgi:AraC-like DNA-binding protein
MVAKIIRRSSHPIEAPAGFSAQPTVIASDDPNLPVQQVRKDIGDSKYERSALDARTRQRILSKLEAAMATSRMYLDSQLTLTKLCAELNENTHYVSQVINQDLETTFYDLVNRYRVENAKAMLLSDTGKTVLEIALESGFNSKSTFNAAFRLHAATTPSAYRKQDRPVSA